MVSSRVRCVSLGLVFVRQIFDLVRTIGRRVLISTPVVPSINIGLVRTGAAWWQSLGVWTVDLLTLAGRPTTPLGTLTRIILGCLAKSICNVWCTSLGTWLVEGIRMENPATGVAMLIRPKHRHALFWLGHVTGMCCEEATSRTWPFLFLLIVMLGSMPVMFGLPEVTVILSWLASWVQVLVTRTVVVLRCGERSLTLPLLSV